MKNVKTSLIALSVGLCSVIAAVGGKASKTPPPPLGATNYTLNAVITNTPLPVVAAVTGVPLFDEFASNSAYGVVYTDGSGKLDGVEDMIFTNLNLCAPFTSGDFITQIGGSIATVGGKGKGSASSVVVTMTMKGNGYVQNDSGSTQSAAGLNLSFSGKLFPSNSVVALTTTNTFLYIGTNFGSTHGFTNEYTYLPVTNYNFYGGYQTMDLIYYIEQSYTNTATVGGTNTTLISDTVCSSDCYIYFGTPTGTTNIQTTTYCTCTNVFTNVVIGTNITFDTRGTNILNASTNYIYGLNISNLSAWLAAATNCLTNGNTTGYVQVVTATISNTVSASAYTNIYNYAQVTSGGSTNTTSLTFSNGWFEVDGALKGQITAGKCKQSFNNTNAALSGSYTLYTSFVGSGSNTNGPYFGTNKGSLWIATNDSGVFYVVSEYVPNSDLSAISAFNPFRATVKQVANNIWISANGGFIGTGTQTPKKGTYKVNMTGVGRLSGSSLVITGATGIDIVGFTALTNMVTITNTASVPPVAGVVLNTNLYNSSVYTNIPSQIIAGQFVGGGTFDYFLLATNGAGTTNIVVTNVTICSDLSIPPLIVTNTVNCIRSIFGNGKVLGQKVSGSGTNMDATLDD